MKLFWTLAFGGLLGFSQASAAIINPSFEDPDVGTSFSSATITGWTGSPGASFFFGVTGEPFIPPFVDGDQAAYVNNFDFGMGATNHSLSQTLSDVVTANTNYTLSAWFGWRNDNLESGGRLEFWAGGAAVDGDVVGGTLLGSTNVSLTQGIFIQGSVLLSIGGAHANLGDAISIRLVGIPNGDYFAQTNFDLVELNATSAVPEPASISLLVLGAAGFLGYRRNRLGSK